MILIDDREKKASYAMDMFEIEGIECAIERQPTGDYFMPLQEILIERKTVPDFLGSFAGGNLVPILNRMEELKVNGEIKMAFLLIEGRFEINSDGKIVPMNRTWAAKRAREGKIRIAEYTENMLHSFLISCMATGVHVMQTNDFRQSMNFIISLHEYMSKSHAPIMLPNIRDQDTAHLYSLCMAKGIGPVLAGRILRATSFGKVIRMTGRDIHNLKIKGLGQQKASALYHFFKEE